MIMSHQKRMASKMSGLDMKKSFIHLSAPERNIEVLFTISEGNGGWKWRPEALRRLGYSPLEGGRKDLA